MTYYNVSIEAIGPTPQVDQLETLIDVLADLGAPGASVGAGGLAGGPSAIFAVEVPNIEAEALEYAVHMGTGLFTSAVEKTGIPMVAIARVDVMAEPYFERWLTEGPDELVGLSEIAEILGVSKQRVDQLRDRDDFPMPIVELRSGPVWRRDMLNRFIREWPRRPGRPAKAST